MIPVHQLICLTWKSLNLCVSSSVFRMLKDYKIYNANCWKKILTSFLRLQFIYILFFIPFNFQYIHHIFSQVDIKYQPKLHMLRVKKELQLSSWILLCRILVIFIYTLTLINCLNIITINTVSSKRHKSADQHVNYFE